MKELENEYRKRLNNVNKDFTDHKYDRVFGTVNSDNDQESESESIYSGSESDQPRDNNISPYFNNHNMKQSTTPLNIRNKDARLHRL
jgi:hypothetical protein